MGHFRVSKSHASRYLMRLGARVGQGCENVRNRYMRELQVNLIELDEESDLIQKKKQKRVRTGNPGT